MDHGGAGPTSAQPPAAFGNLAHQSMLGLTQPTSKTQVLDEPGHVRRVNPRIVRGDRMLDITRCTHGPGVHADYACPRVAQRLCGRLVSLLPDLWVRFSHCTAANRGRDAMCFKEPTCEASTQPMPRGSCHVSGDAELVADDIRVPPKV